MSNNRSEAVIVRLKISKFGNTGEDKSVTAEVKALHSIAGNTGRWVKAKLDPKYMAGVVKADGHARTVNDTFTLPWECGYRLLPVAAQEEHRVRMAVEEASFNAEVDAFVGQYPTAVQDARESLGRTFREGEYPPVDAVRGEFGFRLAYQPMPAAAHFTSAISGRALEEMRSGLERDNASRLEQAQRDLWDRIIGPVQALAAKLADPGAIFRDSLVGNVREVLGSAASLNISGDPRILEAVGQITSTLNGIDADTLRDNGVIRSRVAAAAKGIVTTFGAIGSRKFS